MLLTLLCHGATATMRRGGFPTRDDRIDEGARRRLTRVDLSGTAAVAGPDEAARETAQLLGLAAPAVARLRDIDHGSWNGRSFAAVQAGEPAAFAHWLAAPWDGTPDGESFAAAVERVAGWIATVGDREQPLLAIVSPTIVRAVLAATIGVSAPVAMRIDIAPLTATILSRHRGWRLQRIGDAFSAG